MKTSIRTLGVLFFIAMALVTTSCSKRSHSNASVIVTNKSNKSTHLPPGQAKKVHGDQSAKQYAPGQQKKKSGTTVVVKN